MRVRSRHQRPGHFCGTVFALALLVLFAMAGPASAAQPGLPVPVHPELEDLGWLIGRWTSGEGAPTCVMEGAWSEGGGFLFLDVQLGDGDNPRDSCSNRIAWDSLRKEFRSWSFQPDGGFSEGRWSAEKGGWKVVSTGVSTNGLKTVEEVHLRPDSPGQMSLDITGRKLGDERLPDVRLNLYQGAPPPEETMPGLEGITWELYELRGVPMEFDRSLTVRFEAGNVQAFGGVNRMAGSFELAEGRLKIGSLRTTRMAGPPELMELEQTFADTLAAADGCQIENRELCLLEGAEAIARFREGR
jgi:heat shock protein HslJ